MRRLLVWILASAGLVATALVGAGFWFYSAAETDRTGERTFDNELRIPPLLEPRPDAHGRKVFDLSLKRGETEFLPGKPAETWGVNGDYLGPTLRARRGDEVLMKVDNGLPETTTLHWHGMHLPAVADGGPHQKIEPGSTWSPTWTVDQPAATLWYHPHPHGDTEDHVYRGVAGMFILDDARGDALALPRDYGVDDIPLIVQDKRLDDDGGLDFSRGPVSPIGRLGDEILVNGTHDPHLNVSHERVRFRLLNASTARIYDIGFADGRDFALIGTEGGLIGAPHRMKRIRLSPGERAEIVADFEPGEKTVLRSFEPDLGTNFFEGRFSGADDSFHLLEVRTASELAPSPRIPARLAPEPRLDEGDAVRTRRFELSGSRRINGKEMDLGRIDERVTVGTTEVWEVHNESGTPHSFHPHDVRFRILDYAGEPPPPELAGWKDTVYVPPGERVRLVTRFEDYADPANPYMFHCHILRHEDQGMMGQFTVAEGGREPPPPHTRHHHE
jgi:FtsP/CotA-like multicopper oxidase with cupredoxin domain